jgi:hypothetical protein
MKGPFARSRYRISQIWADNLKTHIVWRCTWIMLPIFVLLRVPVNALDRSFFIDRSGTEVRDPNSVDLLPRPPRRRDMGGGHDLGEGLTAIEKNGKWTFVDATGRSAINLTPQCTLVNRFSEGLAAVAIGGTLVKDGRITERIGAKLGFIDRSGKFAIPPIFPAPSHLESIEFVEGLAPVPMEKKGYLVYGYIDKYGHFAIPPKFKGAKPFRNGRAWVFTGTTGFDRDEWEARGKGPLYWREDLFKELLHEHAFIGMWQTDVYKFLGFPQTYLGLPFCFESTTYTLSRTTCEYSHCWVEICAKSGKVWRYRYCCGMGREGPWITENVPTGHSYEFFFSPPRHL